MEQQLRVCKKCLLRDQEEAAYASIAELLAQMDPALKAPDDLYEERLSHCKQCEKLLGGMCRACGCFVEVRAAVLKQSCPDPVHYW